MARAREDVAELEFLDLVGAVVAVHVRVVAVGVDLRLGETHVARRHARHLLLCLALAKVGAVYAWAAPDADSPANVAPVRLAVLLARGLLAALLHEDAGEVAV